MPIVISTNKHNITTFMMLTGSINSINFFPLTYMCNMINSMLIGIRLINCSVIRGTPQTEKLLWQYQHHLLFQKRSLEASHIE